jgi:hypothetical protein
MFLMSSAQSLSFYKFLATSTILNPLAARYFAQANPIPSVLPVTTAQESSPYLAVDT